jgi:hypothetical protein
MNGNARNNCNGGTFKSTKYNGHRFKDSRRNQIYTEPSFIQFDNTDKKYEHDVNKLLKKSFSDTHPFKKKGFIDPKKANRFTTFTTLNNILYLDEKLKGKDSLLRWSDEENNAYKTHFQEDKTIVLFICGHGCILPDTLQIENIHWYSNQPYFASLIGYRDISNYLIQQLRLLYEYYEFDANNERFDININRIKSMNIVNHFKVLQKFMSTKIFNNVTINELHMDTYNDVALLEDKKKSDEL